MRRPSILRVGALAGLGLAALALGPSVPSFVWNASASAPLGLYRVEQTKGLQKGDLVLAWAPESARRLADSRGYLPESVPLTKRIAATSGDTVCGRHGLLLINGWVAAIQLPADPQGRPLPPWTGCRVLGADEVFLLMSEVWDSFDGRYFGPIPTSSILGKLVPIWTR
ncbi:conjugative transfer signal peptidase TraF [Enhydrobacter aerosaccus]|uniref:Conjugative transfer signal peptidase TraF n=1 Tax=Enhydrobacter aerosaccus TaxID=225324 RepID=A0A1T4S8Q6_9HYPH|nr:S26 family signal peptidase [Enhydrobacter aerosaccus]SKA24623.1 conjugative transfer signal peptidase TraF [Enhydrobacter aerosaccus]